MTQYIIRRLLSMIPMLLGISLVSFLLMYITPGDSLSFARVSKDIPLEYIETMEKQFGLDQPWYIQYGLWLKNIICLNFGESWTFKVPVIDVIANRIPFTILLSVSALGVAWMIAIPLGTLAAIYKDSFFDRLSSGLAYIAVSIPEFFLALLAVLLAARTGWFPIGGRSSITYEFLSPWDKFWDILHHLTLPTLVLGLSGVAGMMRLMRANVLEYIRSDFVLTAKAKGVSEGIIMFKHVLRNAINPLITVFGFAFSGLLSGALLVENIMQYPGLGKLVYEAFMRHDQYLVMAAVMMSAFMLMIGNLIADLLLFWCDPRIRSGMNKGK